MVTTVKTLTISRTMSAMTLTVPAPSSPPLSTATGSQKATITTSTASTQATVTTSTTSRVTTTTILVIPVQSSSDIIYPAGNSTMKATGSVSASASGTSAVPKQSVVSAGAKGMEGRSFGVGVVALGIALVVL